MDTILQMLKEIRPEFDFSGDDGFIEAGFLDSYDMIMLISALDDKFGISISGMDIVPENFNCVASIVALVEKYGAKL